MKIRHAVSTAACAALLGSLLMLNTAARSAPDQTRGQTVFHYWCAPCHTAGPGHPGTQSLEIKYKAAGLTAVLEERKDLTPELVTTVVRKGILSMPPFRKTEISDAELADIAAYLSK